MSYARYFQAEGYVLVPVYRKYPYAKYTEIELAKSWAKKVLKWDAYISQAAKAANTITAARILVSPEMLFKVS